MAKRQSTRCCSGCHRDLPRSKFSVVYAHGKPNGYGRRCDDCRTPDPSLPDEEWRAVVGYEGWYEVSNLGRVRRIKASPGTTPGMVLTPSPKRDYLCVNLQRRGVRRQGAIHVLVAAAFIGPCPEGYEVNHIDGVKANCTIGNLEYLTPSQNGLHAVRMGLRVAAHGDTHYRSRLSASDIPHIRNSSESDRQLAERYGVDKSAIWAVRNGKTWKHVREGGGDGA